MRFVLITMMYKAMEAKLRCVLLVACPFTLEKWLISLSTCTLCFSEYEREQKRAGAVEEDKVFNGGLRIPGSIWHKLYR